MEGCSETSLVHGAVLTPGWEKHTQESCLKAVGFGSVSAPAAFVFVDVFEN